jgi:hypothetical protein
MSFFTFVPFSSATQIAPVESTATAAVPEAHHEPAVVVAAVDQIHQIPFDKETTARRLRPLIQELAVFVENLYAVVRSVGIRYKNRCSEKQHMAGS